jgi:Conserved in the green lineage and diatoms 27
MKSSAPVCPVPLEQQPLNEYESLKDSWFYSWGTRNLRGYLKPIVILWLLSWLLVAPIALVSFPWAKYPAQFILSGAAGASLFPLLALLRLYLGWGYICDRLSSETIFYEESGWYDGQTWTKPAELLQRDRLIVSYQIQPILQRLKWTFASMAGLFGLGAIAWCFL